MKFSVPHIKESPLLIIILTGLAAFGIFSTSIYLPSMLTIANDLESSQTMVQFTLTSFFIGSAVGQIIMGPIADHYGRLKVAYGGILVFAITSIACTMVSTMEQLIFLRFIHGMAASVGPLLSRAIARDIYSGVALAKISATTMMVISVSPAIAPVIGGYLQLHFGWFAPFYFLSISGVVLFFMIFFMMPETNPSTGYGKISIRKVLKNYVNLLKDRQFLGYTIILSVMFCSAFMFISMSPFIFLNAFHWNEQEYAWVMSVITIGNMSGFSLSRRITSIVSPNKAIILSASLMISVSVLYFAYILTVEASSWSLLLFVIAFMASSAIGLSNAMAAAMNRYPNMAGTAAAFMGAIQIGSGAIGSMIAGFLPDIVSYLVVSMGGIVTIGFTVYIWNQRSIKES